MKSRYEVVYKAKIKGLSLRYLLREAKVSKSGYYYWLAHRDDKVERDASALDLIRKIFLSRNRKVGVRQISMIARKRYGIILNPKKLLIHSDQGIHYTHPIYGNTLREYGVKQSMSRKGNCLDNAPIESFFGHLKDEVTIKDCKSIEEVREKISEFIKYYNNDRPQWTLKKMTPKEYRCHLMSLIN